MDATIIRSVIKSYFHVSYSRRMPGTFASQRPCLGDACQSRKMAILLNSLFFFKTSFRPNYRVKYYDYIVLAGYPASLGRKGGREGGEGWREGIEGGEGGR